ncbi:hypothetical protein Moror_5057 [Moniliophthora roreri MCA 2997]|uniref:DUF7514 domain-containing protein n=1 Tax=Moniliophthora roreri (strain MCA 2997) TaxID=1381753 RepID=V2WHH4_MONRO|nr:hypothetical protein Moror_5057 [Moniliophthora roreri MCA 2997]
MLAERFTGEHTIQHQFSIFKRSGGSGENPVISQSVSIMFRGPTSPTSRPEPPPMPPRRPSAQATSPTQSQYSRPPPLPPRQGSSSSQNSQQYLPPTSPPISSPTGLPSSPPPQSRPHPSHASTLPNPPPAEPRRTPQRGNTLPPPFESITTAWGSFFNDDMSPTLVFSDLLNAVFSYLDTENTGYMLPEVYSKFLDDQGYLTHENAWKNHCKPELNLGIPQEYRADLEFKKALDLFSIDYVIHERPKSTVTPCISTITAQFGALGLNYTSSYSKSFLSSEGQMPVLTRKGFIDITCVEVLCDPARHWGNWSRILRRYTTGSMARFREWGELPRNVLPQNPDSRMLARAKSILELAKHKAQGEINAVKAYTSIAAQGRQNALELLSDYRYEYRYY